MSDGQIVGWGILLLVAYGIYRYIKHRRSEEIEAEQLRALLKSKIEDYKKLASARAMQDRFFSERDKKRALEKRQEGLGLMTAAKAMEAVVFQRITSLW